MRFIGRVLTLAVVYLYLDQVKGHCENDRGVPNNGQRIFVYEVYTCNEGYTLSGPGNLTYSNGTWSGDIPTCEENNCSSPGLAPVNGQKSDSLTFYKHGSSVEFSCNSGYELYGPSILTCMAGKWNDDVPKCVAREIPTTTKKTEQSKPDTGSITSKYSLWLISMMVLSAVIFY
ncbi:apolipoprotein R-like isoform X2 [Glandiceps talaboti]